VKLDFTYDYQGRRVQKVVSTNNGSTYVVQYTNRFVYDGWNVVAILDGGNNLVYSFRWGTDASGSQQGAGGIGGLISMTVHSGPGTGVYFYCFDGNHNVVALINASDGTIAAQYEYGPFGELVRATGPFAFINPFRFSTKFQDGETGIVYYGLRYYGAIPSAWLNRDPIGEAGGANLYGFVGNDPVDWIDPLGLIKYYFNKKKCVLKVTLTWSLKFENQSGFGNWTFGQRSRWKRDAERAVENYFSNVPLRCRPASTTCCFCPGGVSIDFDLRYKGFFTFWRNDDYVVTVLPDPTHQSWVNSGSGTAELDIGDVNPQNKGASQPQVPIVHETGHMLGLHHPGGANNSDAAYQADLDSLMGGGMVLRLPDFNQAFCDKISTGVAGCDPWRGR